MQSQFYHKCLECNTSVISINDELCWHCEQDIENDFIMSGRGKKLTPLNVVMAKQYDPRIKNMGLKIARLQHFLNEDQMYNLIGASYEAMRCGLVIYLRNRGISVDDFEQIMQIV